jgi:two-component system nitrate/nitrite response regulator NarL
MHTTTRTLAAPTSHAVPSSHAVLVVECHDLFAQALRVALTAAGQAATRFPIPADAGSQAWLHAQIARAAVDTVVLNLDLGRFGEASPLIPRLTQAGIDVVVLLDEQDPFRAARCLELGAVRVLAKSGSLDDLLATLDAIRSGVPATSPAEHAALSAALDRALTRHEQHRHRLHRLSPREQEVLGALVEGRTVQAIAEDSVVSAATVRTQVKAILAKLEVSSQLAAVALANEVDWHLAR